MHVQKISGFFFYLLGSIFFASYFLFKKEVLVEVALWCLQRLDLPFLFVALLYGGSSVYRSLHRSETLSKGLFFFIAIPLTSLFLLFLALNFWEVLPFEQGEALLGL